MNCDCAKKAKKAKARPPRVLYESIAGCRVYREDEKGRRTYRVKCEGCGMTGERRG